MLTENDILFTLDNSYKTSAYCPFIGLGHPYSYLIDCRLNIFRGAGDRWAIAAERLGYSERGGRIALEIYYYGNCLINLESYNDQLTNYYTLLPIEDSSFEKTTDGFSMNPEPGFWLIKDDKIHISENKQDYTDNGIELDEYEPGEIRVHEAARLAIINHRNLFRARDYELYKSIPADLEKILVLDEWYHKDFIEIYTPKMSVEHLKQTYEFNQSLQEIQGMDFDAFENTCRSQELRNEEENCRQWTENRPGSYETWQQLAKIIVTGDISFYKPTLSANTNWKNWPESGSL